MSKNGPRIGSVVHVNGLVWITSLRPDEQGVTTRILDDLGDFFKAINLQYFVHEPTNASELINLLDEIAEGARLKGFKPIIHFDTHGGKDTGLHITASRENVPWETVLAKLRAINVATGNNLCVVSLACFGFYLTTSLSILEPSPFYILAAPPDTVTAGYVENVVLPFYDRVFRQLDIVGAFTEVLSDKLLFLHCEEMLFTSMKGYVRDGCTGKGAQARVEERISYARRIGLVTPQNIKLMRKITKDHIKPTQALLDRYVQSFLLGKPVPYTMNDLLEQIAEDRRKGIKSKRRKV